MSTTPHNLNRPEDHMRGLEVIDQFVDSSYKQGYYEDLAERVHDICKAALPKDIKAITTFRGKEKESLRIKLQAINQSRKSGPFEDTADVERSVFDLAGVRLALHVPSQKERVKEIINKAFPVHGPKWIEKRGKGTFKVEARMTSYKDEVYNPVFGGYHADHAHVKISEEQSRQRKPLRDWQPNHFVEIQVVSILLYAWADLEHDIVYKSIHDEPDIEERQMLDSVNGMIISTELVMDQLHIYHTKRIERLKVPFANKFELAVFLNGYIGPFLNENEKNNLELKMFFGLLKAIKKNSQEELRPYLKELGFKKHADLEQKAEDRKSDELREILGKEKYTRYIELSKTDKPLQLARHMTLLFLIMESILSKLPEEEEKLAQRRAIDAQRLAREARRKSGSLSAVHIQTGASSEIEEDESYRCSVILSSFIWLGQLWRGGSIAGVKTKLQPKLDSPLHIAFEWPFNGPSRFNILVSGEKTNVQDAKNIEALWRWFEREEKDTYSYFAFRISKLGVLGSFPDDLALLTEHQGSR